MYVKLNLSAIESEYSDYSRATPIAAPEFTATPDEATAFKVDAETAGTTLDLSMFTTVTGVLVVNLDTTNYIDVDWTYSATASKAKALANDFIKIGAVTVANDLLLTANTATCRVLVYVWGT